MFLNSFLQGSFYDDFFKSLGILRDCFLPRRKPSGLYWRGKITLLEECPCVGQWAAPPWVHRSPLQHIIIITTDQPQPWSLGQTIWGHSVTGGTHAGPEDWVTACTSVQLERGELLLVSEVGEVTGLTSVLHSSVWLHSSPSLRAVISRTRRMIREI